MAGMVSDCVTDMLVYGIMVGNSPLSSNHR